MALSSYLECSVGSHTLTRVKAGKQPIFGNLPLVCVLLIVVVKTYNISLLCLPHPPHKHTHTHTPTHTHTHTHIVQPPRMTATKPVSKPSSVHM